MFHPQLSTPGGADVRHFEHDAQAHRAALDLKKHLVSELQALHPFTIAALARQRYPGEPDYHAVAKFGLELGEILRHLADHGYAVQRAREAERARLAPIVDGASRRSFQIARRLSDIAQAISRHEAAIKQRREKLIAAGVSGEDLERLSEPVTVGELQAEQIALRIEGEALQRFMATGDEHHLPAGFVVPEPVPKVSQLPTGQAA